MLVSQEGRCSMEVCLILAPLPFEVLTLFPDHVNIPSFTALNFFSRFHVMKV
jgi:hypothetical protein